MRGRKSPDIINLDDSFGLNFAKDIAHSPTIDENILIPHPPPLPPPDFLKPPRRSNRLLKVKPPVYVIRRKPEAKRKKVMPVDRSPPNQTNPTRI